MKSRSIDGRDFCLVGKFKIFKIFVFEPAKAYSERLAKSIDGLWKEAGRGSGDPFGTTTSGRVQFWGHRTAALALGVRVSPTGISACNPTSRAAIRAIL